jgi:hypothetical protein
MADKRISQLNSHTTPSGSDLLVIVNNNETKKITYSDLIPTAIDISPLNTFTQSIDGRIDSLESWSSSLDTTFATDLQVSIVSSSVAATIGVISQNTGLVSTSSFNQYTASQSTGSLVDRLNSIENTTSSYELKGSGILSGSISYTDLTNVPNGIVSESTDLSSLNSFTASYFIDSASVDSRITSEKVRIDAILTASTANTDTFAEIVTLINSVDLTNDNAFATYYTSSNARISSLENVTSSYETKGSGILSGSISYLNLTNIPSGIVSQSTDLTSLNNFTASISTASLVDRLNAIENISGSWITESETGSFLRNLNGAISTSSQLTSSFDTRYVISGSVQPLPSNLVSSSAQITALGFISSSTTINTSSFATTGSNTFNGNQTITGSLIVSSVAVVNGGITIPTGSILSLTSGSSILVDASGAITGSLTGSIFGIGNVATFSQSVDNRLDTLELSIISGSPNYTQVLGNRRTSITTTGVSIISGSITTTGNPVQIMVTGDANPVNVTSWTRLQIYRDETAIGNIVQVENSSNLNVPYCLNVIDTPPAGTYSYSMRTVSGISGLFDFGEHTGPLLTAVELKTNTNLPSTNNTFTGNNTFNGSVLIGPGAGNEGGELNLAYSPNTTLTGSAVSVDVYTNTLRIFEGGGNSRGVYIDLSKAPNGVGGELMWKASGMVAAGTFVSLDNLKCTVTTSGSRGLSIGAVSTTFEADVSGWYTVSGGNGGGSTNNITYTTTASTSIFGWNFPGHGDTVQCSLRDKTNNRFYRITMMIGISYISNFISIERLF